MLYCTILLYTMLYYTILLYTMIDTEIVNITSYCTISYCKLYCTIICTRLDYTII